MATNLNRRDFVKAAGVAGVASATLKAAAKPLNLFRSAKPRVIGANDRINLAQIGCGGRSRDLLNQFNMISQKDDKVKIVAVCDVYEKRKKAAADKYSAQGYLDYREVLNRSDIDAVVIATPDHWHAPLAIAAMKAGKDVYLEKPMSRTVEEAKEIYEASVKYNRILQIGSQTTSSDQWWKARKAVQDGMIGKMIMSQGSYHRNSTGGEWNYTIDPAAGPNGKGDDYIDWKMWLGAAPKMDYNADRFFRFRKYWDYSGGIATDLFYHVMAPLNLVWGGGEFPRRATEIRRRPTPNSAAPSRDRTGRSRYRPNNPNTCGSGRSGRRCNPSSARRRATSSNRCSRRPCRWVPRRDRWCNSILRRSSCGGTNPGS